MDAPRNAGDGFDAKGDDVRISYENVQTGWSFKAAPLFDVRHTVLQYVDMALL